MMIVARSNRGEYKELGVIVPTKSSELGDIYQYSQQAYLMWSQISVAQRLESISRFLELYHNHQEVIAQSISKEIGKAISQSRADVAYDLTYIKRHCDHAVQILRPEIIDEDNNCVHTGYYDATGVTAVISPWNYPSSQRVWEIIPPLIAGNTIIYKASSACIWTAKLLNDMLMSCLPDHVFQPIYGDGSLGNQLTMLPVSQIVFTGSTKVGRTIQSNAAGTGAQTHCELGGSAAGIILPDTLITDEMMMTIEQYRVQHAGQICDGLKRLFVHSSQYEEVVQAIMTYFETMYIGDPLSGTSKMGCLISEQSKALIESDIVISQSMGATVIELGILDATQGPFMPMVLLTHVTHDMPVMTKEVFGPVLPIVSYETIDEVLSYANDTIYGLGGYLRGDDMQLIDNVCRALHTGNISVNNTSYLLPQIPFGGYTNASGNMREHGIVGLRSYCQLKVVSKPK